jgi:hypothetical protein
MHDTAERGGIADSYANGFAVADADPVADELTDPVAFADRTPFVRSAQRALGHRRVGTGGRDTTLPFLRSWRHMGGALDRAGSRQH